MAFDTNQDRRVKLAFGEFDCEIVGYDDPLRVLDKILGLYVAIAETSPALVAGGAPEAAKLRARFAEIVGENASRLGLSVSARGGGVTVSPAPADEAPPLREQSATPAHLAGMDPGLLAEFAAMRARLKDRDEPAAEPAGRKDAAPAPAAATEDAAPRPRVRIIRAERPKADEPVVAETAASPAAAPGPTASPAPAVAETTESSPSADAETDNFLFAETPDAAAPELPAEPAAAAQGKEQDVSRFGFLRRIMPQAPAAEKAPLEAEGPFRRLREASEAALPRLDQTARAGEPRLSLVRPVRAPLSGPAAFAAEAGASGLTEHVEAAAAWLALSENRPRFSRRDVMQALAGIEAAAGYSLEARMKAFRTLLKTGVLVREEDGLYALSHAARFGHEGRLRA